MERCIKVFLIINCILCCDGVSWRRQLEHIANARIHSQGLTNKNLLSRRFYQYDPRELSNILGAPSRPSHLPEAEPILPGHTLLKPTLGMLKSAVKFPHKDLEDGAGVYGNIDNLGIRYGGHNERNLYTGFRRTPLDYMMVIPRSKNRFTLKSTVLDLATKEEAKNGLLKILKRLNIPLKGVKVFYATLSKRDLIDLKNKESGSYYLTQGATLSNKKFLRNNTVENNQIVQSSSSGEHPASNEETLEKNSKEIKKINKMEWFMQTKNSYDHIKVNQDAPELPDLIPAVNEDTIRKWWFYNTEDYVPFQT